VRPYSATYTDKRGQEEIVIRSNGSELFTSIRGHKFDGGDFDQLTAEKIDNDLFDYEMFADGTGDITNFQLSVTFPIKLYDASSKRTTEAELTARIVVGEYTSIDGLDHELHGLSLSTSLGEFTLKKKLEWMEDALIELQNQLPKEIYLQTCLSCKFSNYHPVGSGMFGSMCCFRNYKEDVSKFTSKYDLMDSWTNERIEDESLFFTQETFDCEEHELPTENDWYYKNWTKLIWHGIDR